MEQHRLHFAPSAATLRIRTINRESNVTMKSKLFMPMILAAMLGQPLAAAAKAPVVQVYKTPTCGCCSQWVSHLEDNGFTVQAHDVPSTADYRQKAGIPVNMGSCHTATVGGYAIEGHVPAADIKRLLKEKPAAVGLAVPGMPMGSPGMEAAHSDAYAVVLIQKNGLHKTYRQYEAKVAK